MDCKACGAPIDHGGLVCGFCGVAQRVLVNPEEEVQAIKELGMAWSRMGQQAAEKTGSLTDLLTTNHPLLNMGKGKSFWGQAFMPSSVEGLFAAAEQSAMLVGDVSWGDSTTAQLNGILISRMDNCIELLEVKAPNDPRLSGMIKLLDKRKEENKGLKKMGMCFPESAKVWTPAGLQAIEHLEPGDPVYALDGNGNRQVERVTRLRCEGWSKLLAFQTETSRIRCTPSHSLQSNGTWACAHNIRVGDRLQCISLSGETTQQVVLSISAEIEEPVYSLWVTGAHTAVVDGVLTHNFSRFRALRVAWHRVWVDPWIPDLGRAANALP